MPTPPSGNCGSTYDREGRAVKVTQHATVGALLRAVTEVIAFDEDGNPLQVLAATGHRTNLTYGEVGRRARRVRVRRAGPHDAAQGLPQGSSTPSIDDQFAYDALGRQILARNTVTEHSFEYDALDRAVSVYDEAFGTARRVYDADGRVVQAVYPDGSFGYPEGRVTTYQYDARGAVVGISDSIGGTWQLDYDAAGRPIRQTSPFGVDREIAYTNEEGFVDKVTLRNGAGDYLDVFDYNNYDALGNPQQIKTCEGMATCSPSPTGTTTIGYDALSRVVSVSYPGSSESFTYDRAGNRRTHTVNGTLRTLDVDAADQLTAIRQGSTVLESFTYDAAGRRSTRTVGATTTTYAYDPLGRLQGVASPSLTNLVLYDALDTRYYSWSAQTGRADYFLGEWAEMRGSERVRFVHGPGIDAVLAEVSGSTTRALQADAGGNVIHATTGGTIGETRRYGAFGAVRSSSGTQVVCRGFAGRPVEAGSGLVYLRARHYDPATGRFLQPDPIGIETDQLYAYAANNPYVYSDPMGLAPGQHSAFSSSPPPSLGDALWNLGSGLALAGAGFIPWVGDALDVHDVLSPSSTLTERGISSASLGINVWTAGLAPNAGPIVRGAGRVGGAIGDLGAIAARNIPDVALGLSQHPLHAAGGLLRRFADHVGAVDFWRWPDAGLSTPGKFVDEFAQATSQTGRIHFNLDGISDVQDALRRGMSGPVNGNVTNWELLQIQSSPDLFNKTRFYRDGRVVGPSNVF